MLFETDLLQIRTKIIIYKYLHKYSSLQSLPCQKKMYQDFILVKKKGMKIYVQVVVLVKLRE